MIVQSPNEIANELAKLNKDARLRRLKAVRSAASRVQQQRLSSFRKHFESEKMVVEEAAQIQRARITLSDISGLEDELRLALTQMGAAHQNALTSNAQLTEKMLRENESFKAHVTMSNLRFEAAIELIRAFRHQQQILRSAPAEQRMIAFLRAKELLKKIASINERARLRYKNLVPCHPYDSIHELTPAGPIDFRVTRIHVDATGVDAASQARIEDERHHERLEQTEILRRRQSQAAECRAEIATDAVHSRRMAAEVKTSLRDAVVQDRQRKLRIVKQRSSLPPRPKQSQIKRAFETAMPELQAVQREQQIRIAQRRLQQRSKVASDSSNVLRTDSPDDLLERFAGSEDAAVIPNSLFRNIINVFDDNDAEERKEQDPIPTDHHGQRSSPDAQRSQDAEESRSRPEPVVQEEKTNLAPTSEPEISHEPKDSPSPERFEERRSVAFSISFDGDISPPRPKRRTRSPDSSSASTPTPEPTQPEIQQTTQNPAEPIFTTPALPPSEPIHTEPLAPPAPTDPSGPNPAGSSQLSTQHTTFSRSPSPPSEPDILVPSPENDDGKEAVVSDRSESVSPIRASGDELKPIIDSPEAEPVSAPSPAISSAAHELANSFGVDIGLMPSVDLSMDDLTELDRRAEELLRSHIPTTPQLLALSPDSDPTSFDFRLDEDGDDYAIQLLGVDSEELASSFAQTLDETLEFLRQSRQEIDNLRSEVGHQSHGQDRQAGSVEGPSSNPISPSSVDVQSRRIITIIEDESVPSRPATPDATPESDSHDASREQPRADDEVRDDQSGAIDEPDLSTSALSSERTTDDDRSSSLQEQFRANVALIGRIEQRRAEVRRWRQSRPSSL